jgi:hypothetical protein
MLPDYNVTKDSTKRRVRHLDKEATSYDNVSEAFRLSLHMFKLKVVSRLKEFYFEYSFLTIPHAS